MVSRISDGGGAATDGSVQSPVLEGEGQLLMGAYGVQ